MLRETLERLWKRENLSREEARAALTGIFAGDAGDAAIAGLLAALAVKGETADELVGFAEAMRGQMVTIGGGGGTASGRRLDTCGTGGGRHIFNVSTAAALAAAGAGAAVAKHGNRSSTSFSGSADVLEALGVDLDCPPARLETCLEQNGIVFLFAPLLHPAMKKVMPARRALGVRTIFNLLGPLTNPAGADAQVIGVPSAHWIPIMAAALLALGTGHSFVVHSRDGLGEFSVSAPTDVAEIWAGSVQRFTLDPSELGLEPARPEALACGSLGESVATLRHVLAGEPGPAQDMVALNAAAALMAAGSAGDFGEGLEQARRALTSGAAQAKLEALARFTRAAAPAATAAVG
ncbi:MAG: anthranilate phosphoribosyltransferase [Terriglobales bacterium]